MGGVGCATLASCRAKACDVTNRAEFFVVIGEMQRKQAFLGSISVI